VLSVHKSRHSRVARAKASSGPCLYVADRQLIAECGDGAQLEIATALLDGAPLDCARFRICSGTCGAGLSRPRGGDSESDFPVKKILILGVNGSSATT